MDQDEYLARYIQSLELLAALGAKSISAGVPAPTADLEAKINGLLTYDGAVIKTPAAPLTEFHRRLGSEITADTGAGEPRTLLRSSPADTPGVARSFRAPRRGASAPSTRATATDPVEKRPAHPAAHTTRAPVSVPRGKSPSPGASSLYSPRRKATFPARSCPFLPTPPCRLRRRFRPVPARPVFPPSFRPP